MALEYLLEPVFRQHTPDYNMEEVAKSYDYLQQRHDTAIAQESALKKAIGELQLNAEEDEYKQMLLNGIQSSINNSMVGDFKGYALNKIIEEQGNLLSNPGVIGRLRAQQAYKAYQDNLDKRTDLSEDKKNYFREINHYYYKDKVDAAGNVIGGEEWKPIDREVSEVSKSAIMNQALQWAAKESGSGTEAYFLDANGNPTDDYTKSADGNIFMYKNGSYQKLTKDKLREAVNAAIELVPGAKASLEQDYKVAIWKDNKTGGNNYDVRDKNGQLMSYNEYINKGFESAIDAASYYNYTSSIQYGDALKARIEANKKAAENELKSQPYNVVDLIQSNSNLEVVQNTTPSDLTSTIATTKQIISDSFDGININNKSIAELRDMVLQKQSPVERYKLLNAIDELELAESNLLRIKKGMDTKQQEAFDFVNAIESGTVIPNNTISKRGNEFIDSLFPSNAAGIELYFNNDDEQQEFINQIGGIDNLKKLGAEITTINGNAAIYVDRNIRNNIYTIGKALKNARNNTSNMLFELSRRVNDVISLKGNRPNVVIRTNDGNRYDPTWQGEKYGQIISKPYGDYGVHGNGALILNGFVDYVDQQKGITEEALNLNDVPIQTQYIPAATLDEAEARIKLASGIGDASLLNAQINNQQELAAAGLSNVDLTQHNTRVWDEKTGGTYTKVDTEKLMELNGLMVDNTVKKTYSIGFDVNGEPDVIVSMTDKDNKPVRLKIGGIDNETTRAWKANTTIKAKSDIVKLINFDKDIALTNNTSFAGIPKINIDKNLVLTNYDNKQTKVLSQLDASKLRESYLNWTQAANAVFSGYTIDKSRLESIAEQTATDYATIVYNNANPSLILGIKKQLLKNIGL